MFSKAAIYTLKDLPYYLKKLMPPLNLGAHKGQNGKVAVIGGS